MSLSILSLLFYLLVPYLLTRGVGLFVALFRALSDSLGAPWWPCRVSLLEPRRVFASHVCMFCVLVLRVCVSSGSGCCSEHLPTDGKIQGTWDERPL